MKFEDVVLRGSRASQPLATAVPIGTLYCVTDESNIVERSTGAAWESYSPTAGGLGINELTGDVTAGPGSGSQVATLADTAVTPGVYGDDTNSPQITIDSKGRITSAVDVPISGGGGGSDILRITRTFTDAEVRAWGTTPQLIIAGVAGNIISVMTISSTYEWVSGSLSAMNISARYVGTAVSVMAAESAISTFRRNLRKDGDYYNSTVDIRGLGVEIVPTTSQPANYVSSSGLHVTMVYYLTPAA